MTSWKTKIIMCAAAFGLMAPLAATPAAAQYRGDRYERSYDRGYGYQDRRDRRYDDRRYDRRRYDNRRYYNRYDNRYDRRSRWQRHVRACSRAYYSYNPRTDTYRTRYGQVRRCRL